ncbi:MAG: hypothetical protein ACYS4W_02315 [Planctomycetota bacterium]|jgi:hypothetical protein
MDIGKYKDVIQAIVKDYSSLLLPIGIGVVGVLLFIPTQLMNNKLREQIDTESIARGKLLGSLIRNPTPSDQWKVEQDYQRAHERDANEIELLARQSSRRELLSYMIFPEPKDSSTQIYRDFGKQFRGAIEDLLARINARDCPTDAELNANLQRASVSSPRRRRVSYLRLDAVSASIRDDLCRSRAEDASVYAGPGSLGGYEFWGEFKYTDIDSWEEAIRECWYSQLGYWIIRDVIDTIASINAGSASVFTSPVKRLMYVDFAEAKRWSYRGTSSASARKADERPSYALSTLGGIVAPCTGRSCNDDIDVVHFSLSVLLTPQSILPFMQELCSAKEHKFSGWQGEKNEPQKFRHNQVTVLEYELVSVDRDDGSHELYRYGDDAVMQLDLVCEYVFDKAGYEDIKPEAVKKHVEEMLKEVEQQNLRRSRRRARRRARDYE